MSEDIAMERGPNYNWEHEAKHYRDECESLRQLLRKTEKVGDKLFSEKYALSRRLAALEKVAVIARKLLDEGREDAQDCLSAVEKLAGVGE